MEIFPKLQVVLIQLLPFFVLIAVLNPLLFQPMLNYLEERKKRIEGSGDAARSIDSASDQKSKELDAKLAQARAEVADLRNRVLREAQVQERQILDEARHKVEGYTQNFRRELEKARQAEAEGLRAQVPHLGQEMASQVLGRSV